MYQLPCVHLPFSFLIEHLLSAHHLSASTFSIEYDKKVNGDQNVSYSLIANHMIEIVDHFDVKMNQNDATDFLFEGGQHRTEQDKTRQYRTKQRAQKTSILKKLYLKFYEFIRSLTKLHQSKQKSDGIGNFFFQ